MNVKLTEEQKRAIENGSRLPLAIQDEQSHKIYYLLDEQSYLHLEGLRADHERACHHQLRELIDEGIRSPEVPAEEAFGRLRSLAEQLSRGVL